MLWQCVEILESLSCACFVCFIAVIWAYSTLSFGDVKEAKFSPDEIIPRKIVHGQNSPPPLSVSWSVISMVDAVFEC